LLPGFPVEFFDPEKDFLSGSAKGAKGLPEGYLLTNPLDLSDNLLSNPVKKIDVRRIGNVLGLGGGIHRYPSGFYQTHLRPRLEQYRLDLFHPFSSDAVPKLHQGRGFQDLTSLERVESAEALPVSILMEYLHSPLIRTIVPVLQNMDANHQPNRFALTAQGTVVTGQDLMKTVPVNYPGSTKQFMIRIQNIRKQGLIHKKLPLWNLYFHIKGLYHIFQEITTKNPQLSSVFKEHYQCLRGFHAAFFRTN